MVEILKTVRVSYEMSITLQKQMTESLVEDKERKWNEIRKKCALQRDKVMHSAHCPCCNMHVTFVYFSFISDLYYSCYIFKSAFNFH